MKKMSIFLSVTCLMANLFAAPTRSSLGSASMEYIYEAQAIENPYVTDGLIAMFDGEWNAGWGQHKQNLTSWKDLTGNGFDLHADVNKSFPDFSAIGAKFTTGVFLIAQGNLGLHSESNTIELITDGSFTIPSGNWGGVGLNIEAPQKATFAFRIAGGTIYTFSSGQYHTGVKGILRLSVVQSGRAVKFYRDGVYVCGTTINLYDPAVRGTLQVGGMNKTDAFRSFTEEVYSIRIYNRALTVEEIAANYAVDKERFNLP